MCGTTHDSATPACRASISGRAGSRSRKDRQNRRFRLMAISLYGQGARARDRGWAPGPSGRCAAVLKDPTNISMRMHLAARPSIQYAQLRTRARGGGGAGRAPRIFENTPAALSIESRACASGSGAAPETRARRPTNRAWSATFTSALGCRASPATLVPISGLLRGHTHRRFEGRGCRGGGGRGRKS